MKYTAITLILAVIAVTAGCSSSNQSGSKSAPVIHEMRGSK